MNESPHVYGSCTRSAPPSRSHTASHAFGANALQSTLSVRGMWMRPFSHVAGSFGSYPSRTNPRSTHSAAICGLKQSWTTTWPRVMKWSTCSSLRTRYVRPIGWSSGCLVDVCDV
jgi:hypothetical protein